MAKAPFANIYRHTFLLSSTIVCLSIKRTWPKGSCLNDPNAPQKRKIFSIVHLFFRHHTRHIIDYGRRI